MAMWRRARRYAALSYYEATEAGLRLFGKRPPYSSLRLILKGELPEQTGDSPMLGLASRDRLDLMELLSILQWAAADTALKGVLIRIEGLHLGWAKIQELHRGLQYLRDAGKTVWIYFAQVGLPEYVLATVANRILVAPAGTLDITGLSSEVTFVGDALKKLGVEAEVVHVGKYKSAAETFTRSDISEPNREMVESLVQDLYGQAVETIARGRSLTVESVRALIDRGPFTADEAVREGLVDESLYEDEAQDQLKARCGNGAMLEFDAYAGRSGRLMRKQVRVRSEETIAIVHLTGTIRSGESMRGTDSASTCGDISATEDLRELRENDDVKAIVVRVASPGGSALASDFLWHEVKRTRAKKPVVVSFGDVAASGGYYIGVAGKPIFAEAGTLTGSIGVVAGKASIKGLLDQLGVAREVISEGRNSSLHSTYLPMTSEARERLQAEAQFFYTGFVGKVAEGREMSLEAVEGVAQGRVWTGRQALAAGLIDGIGGIQQAVDEAKSLAGIPSSKIVRIERFPRSRRLWKRTWNFTPPGLQLGDWFPWFQHFAQERLWAILPFRFRFF